MQEVGIIIIGRNEAKNLPACFQSVANRNCTTVYSDSASEDDSVNIARQFGIEVVVLKKQTPFSPGRGRNAGAKRMFEINPHVKFIQFVDGDTTLSKDWISHAESYLKEHKDVAIVAGELLEKDSSLTKYKELSAFEWRASPGMTLACGGNFMIRADVFFKVNGFDPSMLGGEDTELCYRVRHQGWKVIHIEASMATHNTKIASLADFWKRCIRTGYGYQQISSIYAHTNEKLFMRQNISNWIFGGLIPFLSLVLIPFTSGLSLLFLLIYPLLAIRIYLRMKSQLNSSMAMTYACACIIGKFPGFYGACKYLFFKEQHYEREL